MSSPQMVPMIYKDGSIGDIPSERVPEALQSGFRHGVNVISKDGLKGTIPLDRMPEALQQGMMPEHAMTPRRPMQSSYGWEDLKNDIATIGGDFNQFLKPSGQAPSGYPNIQYQSPSVMRQGAFAEGPDLKGQAAFQAGLEDAKRKAAGYSPAYRAIAPVAQAIGTNVSGMEQSAAAGDPKGVLLHTVAPAAMGVATAGAFRDVGPQVDLSPSEAPITGPSSLDPITPMQTELSKMFPSKARAGEAFDAVMKAAKDIPIDPNPAGQSALRIQELAGSGGSMPKVVRDFLRRVTDPTQPAMNFSEARDFYSNASRLSADEFNRLTPVMQREVRQFTSNLGQSISGAADSAGVGQQYRGALKDYASAAKNQNRADMVKDALKQTLKAAIPAAGAAYTAKAIWDAKR